MSIFICPLLEAGWKLTQHRYSHKHTFCNKAAAVELRMASSCNNWLIIMQTCNLIQHGQSATTEWILPKSANNKRATNIYIIILNLALIINIFCLSLIHILIFSFIDIIIMGCLCNVKRMFTCRAVVSDLTCTAGTVSNMSLELQQSHEDIAGDGPGGEKQIETLNNWILFCLYIPSPNVTHTWKQEDMVHYMCIFRDNYLFKWV